MKKTHIAPLIALTMLAGAAQAQLTSTDGKSISSGSQQCWAAGSTKAIDCISNDKKVVAPAPNQAQVQVQAVEAKTGFSDPVVKKNAEVRPLLFNANVFFATAKNVLNPSSERRLNELAYNLSGTRLDKITIHGHTDNIGSTASNQKLSEHRAESVKQMLVKLGIPADKIHAVGHGETKPSTTNATDEGRNTNRRVEIEVEAHVVGKSL